MTALFATMRACALPAAVFVLGCNTATKPLEPPPTVRPDTLAPVTKPTATQTAHTGDQPAPPAAPVALEPADLALAARSRAFATDLYKEISASPGNVALSPASISIALAMTLGGARGETAAQMKKVLRIDGEQAAAVRGWGRLSASLLSPSQGLTLKVANRLFGEQSYRFEDAFIKESGALFGAPLERVDFKGAPEVAATRINDWVAEKTERRIPKLVDVLPPLARLVLINAIYFLADWAEPFDKSQTGPEDFRTSATEKKSVSMMHRTDSYRIAHAPTLDVLEVPYRNNGTAMWIVLPKKVDGLAEIERSLGSESVDGWSKGLAFERVAVSLPRFEIDPPQAVRLADTLRKLGMPIAFDRAKADFTGIGNPVDPTERLVISDVLHKAFVKVDEKGTEAAAATAVMMMAAGAAAPPREPFPFVADHPFLYLIIEKTTGLVLFMGRVQSPK